MIKDEIARCIRHHQALSLEEESAWWQRRRNGLRARRPETVFWTHPDLPGRCFTTRTAAAQAAVALAQGQDLG